LVRAEKYASAIAQKNGLFEDTSVNGIVEVAPEQLPLSDRERDDEAATIVANTIKTIDFR
jgi:hypothetical protein